MRNVLACAFCCFTAVAGCKKDVTEPPPPLLQKSDYVNPYAWVGAEHNAGLDVVLADLQSELRSGRPDRDVKRVIKRSTAGFLRSRHALTPLTSPALQFGFDALQNRSPAPFSGSSGLRSLNAMGVVDSLLAAGVINHVQKRYIADIFRLIRSDSSAEDVNRSLHALDQQVAASLSTDEAAIILAISALGAHSASYWHEQAGAWVEVVAEYAEIISTGNSNGQAESGASNRMIASYAVGPGNEGVVEADVTGAVAGSIATVATGCAELTLGVCAGAGALAGGLGTSAGKLLWNIGETIFGGNEGSGGTTPGTARLQPGSRCDANHHPDLYRGEIWCMPNPIGE